MATGERKFKAEITVERYSVDAGNIIGKGAFGVVYIGTDDKGKEVAVKRIDGTDKHKMASYESFTLTARVRSSEYRQTSGHPSLRYDNVDVHGKLPYQRPREIFPKD